jgi:ABC-2 type transport system permease protein
VTTTWTRGTFRPSPGPATLPAMLLAQTAMELRLTMRRGESLLLVLVIPVVLLLLFSLVPLVDLPGPGGRAAESVGGRADVLVPGLLALAVMSTAFTGQAIATGYERSYGVLKRLGSTALPRWVLLAAKTLAVLAVEALQVAVLVGIGLALGWSPSAAGVLPALLLLVVGTAAFSGLGLLMAGTLRAEATLAAANLVYVLLLVVGGVVFPLTAFPDGVAAVLGLLPLAALAEGLRTAFDGGGLGSGPLLVLAVWAAAGLGLAARFFRWE